jgi:ABC-type multidrug transport system fused ATPase/permease subunit
MLAVLRPIARLVFSLGRAGSILLLGIGLVRALIPISMAYVGKRIVDGAIAAASGDGTLRDGVLGWVAIELGLAVLTAGLARAHGLIRIVLGARLGYGINQKLLEKAISLDLAHFESPAVYDKLQNARREATSRPLNLYVNAVEGLSGAVTLASLAAALFTFDARAVLILLFATIPLFVIEARYSGEAFRLFSWRAPDVRRMRYIEMLLTRDDYAKEVKLYGLGREMLSRYRALYERLFGQERSLALRRTSFTFVIGLLSTGAFYGCYAWIVADAVSGRITIGDMTLYIAVFRQGQGALRTILGAASSSYEDVLFMSNLFAFLSIPSARPPVTEPFVGDERPGIRLESVSFRYPGTERLALDGVTLQIAPGETVAIVGENGAGKTTLVKLLVGLYSPTSGTAALDGRPIGSWPPEDLRRRFAVVLQDFVRYQLTAAENVGLGDVARLADRDRIVRAAEQGGAREAIDTLPRGFDTQLGRWFDGGVELSAGDWQRVAVARAFMRDADILILDEPSASLDAEGEHALFERFGELTRGKTAILVSHRFSTVRMAQRIVVLAEGKIVESGTHDALMAAGGRYAHLFNLQAKGYLTGAAPERRPEPRPS